MLDGEPCAQCRELRELVSSRRIEHEPLVVPQEARCEDRHGGFRVPEQGVLDAVPSEEIPRGSLSEETQLPAVVEEEHVRTGRSAEEGEHVQFSSW